MGRLLTVTRCQFPGCGKEILKGATMCTGHWRLYQTVSTRKENKGKKPIEVVPEIKSLERNLRINRNLKR